MPILRRQSHCKLVKSLQVTFQPALKSAKMIFSVCLDLTFLIVYKDVKNTVSATSK
uniref:Uncharacterized protein n=1 Tax=Arundo donax TaxID=35708 RepID=A0A0A9F9X1_ARUDO